MQISNKDKKSWPYTHELKEVTDPRKERQTQICKTVQGGK